MMNLTNAIVFCTRPPRVRRVRSPHGLDQLIVWFVRRSVRGWRSCGPLAGRCDGSARGRLLIADRCRLRLLVTTTSQDNDSRKDDPSCRTFHINLLAVRVGATSTMG